MNAEEVVRKVIALTDDVKTEDDLFTVLSASAHAIGGMACQFPQEYRSQIIMQLVQTMTCGFQVTSKSIGEDSDLAMVIGEQK